MTSHRFVVIRVGLSLGCVSHEEHMRQTAYTAQSCESQKKHIEAIALGCGFILGEIESAYACRERLTINERRIRVLLHLPLSKTDARAIGRSSGRLVHAHADDSCTTSRNSTSTHWTSATSASRSTMNDLPRFPYPVGRQQVGFRRRHDREDRLEDSTKYRPRAMAGATFAGATPCVFRALGG